MARRIAAALSTLALLAISASAQVITLDDPRSLPPPDSLAALVASNHQRAFFNKPDFCKRPPPYALNAIEPEFHIYARNLAADVTIRDESEVPKFVEMLVKDGFLTPSRSLTFLIHGFLGYTPWATWLTNVKDSLLNVDDTVVFMIEWGRGANVFYNYGQSASNTQTMAALLAKLTTAILDSSVYKGDKESVYIHCIGHSLGAHVCGQAGRQSAIFDRATGLDPAGPGFENCTDRLHIDVDSAECVDNIHTDGTTDGHWNPLVPHFGTLSSWGHVNFYPNGGGNQPGCWNNDVPPCSHSRVNKLFAYSIEQGPAACVAAESCTGDGACTKAIVPQAIGYYSSCYRRKDKSQPVLGGNYHLNTQRASPFC